MFDMLDLFGYGNIFSRVMSLFGSAAIAVSIVSAILAAGIAVFTYAFRGFTLMNIGRKAGQKKDWMAFVPFVWDFYRLHIVGAPLWHFVFFNNIGLACIIAFDLLLILLLGRLGTAIIIIATLITFGWIVMRYYITYKFNHSLYKNFGFNPTLALITFVPASFAVMAVLDVMMAYGNSYQWKKRDVGSSREGNTPGLPPQTVHGPNWQPSFDTAKPQGKIFAVSGMYQGASFVLKDNEEISFGRDNTECNLVFDQYNVDVSRKHCVIKYYAASNKYVVTDYSKNGTFTSDGKRLQANTSVQLPAGTELYLGSKKNTFRLG